MIKAFAQPCTHRIYIYIKFDRLVNAWTAYKWYSERLAAEPHAPRPACRSPEQVRSKLDFLPQQEPECANFCFLDHFACIIGYLYRNDFFKKSNKTYN